MALARRVAYETLNEHGSEIAYKIRFDTTRESGTKVGLGCLRFHVSRVAVARGESAAPSSRVRSVLRVF